MVHVSQACVSTGPIITLYINTVVFFEVKLDHGLCFGNICEYSSNKYFIHQYLSVF